MITTQLARWANEQPNRVALQTWHEGRTVQFTYGDLWAAACRTAGLLHQTGIQPGQRIALFADNGPDWVVAYVGTHLAGAVVVPIDAQYGAAELTNLLTFAEARGLFTDEAHHATVDALPAALRATLWVRTLDGATSLLNDGTGCTFEPRPPAPDDLAVLIFTSGTTGEPKGVQLLTRNISSNVESLLAAIRLYPQDNVLNVLPLHHTYSCTVGLLTPLAAGACVTLCASLRGADLLAAMQATGVTIFLGVPQMFALLERGIVQQVEHLSFGARFLFHRLQRLSRAVRKTTGLRIGRLLFRRVHQRFGGKLRFMASGGARLDPDVAQRLLDLGFLILEGYGLTETAPVIAFTRVGRPMPGSVGLPLPGVQVRIDNPGEDGTGEICVRGPNVMPGYFRNPSATALVLRDGWFYTGDLGYLDKRGALYITGRAKEMMVLPSGKKIYPEEIEARYKDALFVKEICILQNTGEDGAPPGLCAVVVPDVDAMAQRQVSGAAERIRFELRRIAADLPSYMSLSDLVLVEGPLPRTRLGKLRRPLIAEMVRRRRQEKTGDVVIELSAEAKALLTHPLSERFLERFEQISGRPGPFYPGLDLELDLGIDSLTWVQLADVLQGEFGVVIRDADLVGLRTLGDLLQRVTEAGNQEESNGTVQSWHERLAERAVPSLAERFELARGRFGDGLMFLLRTVARGFVNLCFRPQLEGMEHFRQQGAMLVCPTHQSYIDAVLIYTLLPWPAVRRMLFLGFAEIFARPPLSWITRPCRIVMTGAAGTMAESLQLSAEGLERGMAVCIFPEGALTLDGEIAEPRPGAGILACERKAPLVPLLIDGSIGTFSRRQPGFRFCRVRLAAGPPILPPDKEHYTQEDYDTMVRQWYAAVQTLRGRKGEQ